MPSLVFLEKGKNYTHTHIYMHMIKNAAINKTICAYIF